MKTRRIGSLDVSIVGLGCNNFGRRLDAEATALVVNAAIDAGITLFDTADIYGGTDSERFLGKALGARRDQIVLATKFGMPIDGAPAGASRAYIRASIEGSLRRLGTDRIDLYQLHRPDPDTRIADTLAALNELVREGKVREIGCSNFSLAQLREAEAAIPSGGAGFACVQNELSLLERIDVADVLPECAAKNLAYLPYFPLAGGMLTGKYQGDAGATAVGRLASGGRLSERFRSPPSAALVDRLAAFATAHGHTLLELAFAWLLSFSPVASVIAGATTPEQARANVSAVGWELDEPLLRDLDAVLADAR